MPTVLYTELASFAILGLGGEVTVPPPPIVSGWNIPPTAVGATAPMATGLLLRNLHPLDTATAPRLIPLKWESTNELTLHHFNDNAKTLYYKLTHQFNTF